MKPGSYPFFCARAIALCAIVTTSLVSNGLAQETHDPSTLPVEDLDLVLEDLPSHVTASMEAFDRSILGGFQNSDVDVALTESFFFGNSRRWGNGQTLRVAFYGGSDNLYRKIEEATKQITDNCNIIFSFRDPQTNVYRKWSPSDADYSAEIRVSFDQPGFFSLVGADSANEQIGDPTKPVGGRCYQRSLNLFGYDRGLPNAWKGTVRHEFMHAISISHEHQSPVSPCEDAFRWDDDAGYVPTQTSKRMYIKDSQGRQPGIYTYMSGYPNFWDKQKVDHNLRRRTGSTIGDFDRASRMLYQFDTFFYKSPASPCIPTSHPENLSVKDIEGIATIYPKLSATSAIEVATEELTNQADAIDAFVKDATAPIEIKRSLQKRVPELRRSIQMMER